MTPQPTLASVGLTHPPVTAHARDPVHHHVRAGLDLRLRALIDHDPGTRTGADPEDLHQARVSVRRMRAVLRAAKPALDGEWADGIRAELGWLGRALGPVRDLDVLLERLRSEGSDLPGSERAAVNRLVAGLVTEREAARAEMLAAMGGARYHGLLRSLATAVAGELPRTGMAEGAEWDSPVTRLEAGGHPLEPRELNLDRLVRKQFRRLARAVDKAGQQPPDDELHALRIDGKRLRYTAELAEPGRGRPMRGLIKATVAFQDVLGDHQDACVAQDRIRSLLAGAPEPVDREVAFVAGRLVEREQARRVDCRDRWWAVWETLRATAADVVR